jgi:hypothetical protein
MKHGEIGYHSQQGYTAEANNQFWVHAGSLTALRALVLRAEFLIGKPSPFGPRMHESVGHKVPAIGILIADFAKQIQQAGERGARYAADSGVSPTHL